MRLLKGVTFLFLCLSFQFITAQEHEQAVEVNQDNVSHEQKSEKEFDLVGTIMHHISDAHEWHFWGEGENAVALYLPVILIDDGVKIFSSYPFYHGNGIKEKDGNYYVMHHEKIYKTDQSGALSFDSEHHPTNEKPLDFSITKNVLAMFIAAILLLVLFGSVARSYRNGMVPRGLAGFLEPLVVFIREDIAIPNIGAKYKRYMPYLLTLFFFIWLSNLLGLVPGAANVTGNIAVTFVLAFITLLVVNFSGNKTYWKHIFDPLSGQMPWYGKMLIYPILVPVEVVGIFTKPIALMIRLFANMTAGHIIILSFISLIFILGTVAVSPASIILTLFINLLELLVSALQAYIFTLLAALFIGMAVQEEH